jgi:hypothetical protein
MHHCTMKRILLSIVFGFTTVLACILLTLNSASGPIWWLLVLPMRFLIKLVPSYKGSFYPDVVVYPAYAFEALVLACIYFFAWSALASNRDVT